jgi:hypothetical protein
VRDAAARSASHAERALQEAIAGAQTQVAARHGSGGVPRVQAAAGLPRAPALIGRRGERERLDALVARAFRGESDTILLLRGPPGIGKTRLLDHLIDHLRDLGGTALSARAFEAEMVRPYGPWIDALRSSPLGDLSAPLVAALLPELAPSSSSEVDAPLDRGRFFDGISRLLNDIVAGSSCTALVLDDVQWLDEASVALLHFIARRRPARLILALGSRESELYENSAMNRAVQSLVQSAALEIVDLAPLDRESTFELARTIAPGVDPALVYSESEGNPFFAVEVTRAEALGRKTRSNKLEDLITERLRRLGDRAKTILPFAAALGRSFELDILARVSDVPAADLLDAIEDLERRGIFRARASAGYDFAHDLLRRAAYEQLSGPRRQLLHRVIAQKLADLPDPEDALAGDLAHHAALGGLDELTARACLRAGQRCQRLFAYEEARALSDQGRKHLASLPKPVRVSLRIQLLSLFIGGTFDPRVGKALEVELMPVLAQAAEAGLSEDVARGFRLCMHVAYLARDLERTAIATLQNTSSALELTPPSKVRQLAEAAHCLLVIEREIPKARSLLSEAQTIAVQHGITAWEMTWSGGLLHAFQGDFTVSTALLERTLERGDGVYASAAWDCHYNLAKIALEEAHYDQIVARRERITPLLAKLVGGHEGLAFEAVVALARFAQNGEDPDRALAALEAADDKPDLAYALHQAARLGLDKHLPTAKRRALRALELAQLVHSAGDAAAAREVLARIAFIEHDPDEARRPSSRRSSVFAARCASSSGPRATSTRIGRGRS